VPNTSFPSEIAALRLQELQCSRAGKVLFRNVNADLQAGQWLYVAGANGVGKTSLLRILCGLSPADQGDILWNGQSIQNDNEAYRRNVCLLGHAHGLQSSLTVLENLRYLSWLQGYNASDDQLTACLSSFGLQGRSHQYVRSLSQGQKRRAALCRLAISPAKLWILDEPFVAMDNDGIGILCSLINQHLKQGGLTILTSHQTVALDASRCVRLDLGA
jgi:heme exporter protein A